MKQQFINQLAQLVQKYASLYGILCHSAIIAQAILESNWGQSLLALVYHNYHGLKCGTKWTGKSVNMKTNEEYQPGVLTSIRDNFRVYDSMEEGVKGYFEFIQLSRYLNLRGITDPRQYLETIKADGYATSTKYVENCMRIIEQYNLTQYDPQPTTVRPVQAIIDLANSWIDKKESDGSHKYIVDMYNSYLPHPRGYKLQYSDAWCAGTVSALAIALGYTDIIPIECSCYYMIEKAKTMGIWIENENRIPQLGELVLYDWQDGTNFQTTDNQGRPDHIGIVTKINATDETFTVVEGNYKDAVGERVVRFNDRFLRGFISPKYSMVLQPPTQPIPSKSIQEMVKEVIAGKWGTGADRKQRLEAAGYNYQQVQQEVNNQLGKKDITKVAQEVIAGKWGKGEERKQRLEQAGYNYREVQNKVNQLLK